MNALRGATTALIAEDEAELADELRDALARAWPELVIVGEADDGLEALRLIEARAPDILFLDIRMPGVSGIEVAKQASGRCHVVFVTAYDEHALAAFDAGAVDYLLKPLDAGRLATTVGRLKDRVRGKPPALDDLLAALAQAGRSKPYVRWLTASHRDELRFITVDEICYVRADNKYVVVVTPDSESLLRRPIRDLAQELDPGIFWQIHRSTLVNVHAIAGIVRDLGGGLRVRLRQRPETLAVSESYAHRFKAM
jgi:DNA-binding LytR/AlgR family response regulator